MSIAVATTGGLSRAEVGGGSENRADLACRGSHENAWVVVPAGVVAWIISSIADSTG